MFIVIFSLLFAFLTQPVLAADWSDYPVKARIVEITEEKEIEVMDKLQWYQRLKLETTAGQSIFIENGLQPLANQIRYSLHDNVLVSRQSNPEGVEEYMIVDFVRTDSLILLAMLFLILLIFISGTKGIFSVLGLTVTFLVVFYFLLPRLLAGDSPVLIAVVSSLFIIPVTFYISHGFNKKTTVAVVASLISLIITAILAAIFTAIGHLTGLSSEEAGMLSIDQSNLNMRGILLAGIVIGTLGVLDDIAISQASIVEELSGTAKLTKVTDLYSRAMVIGKDHISSMVNTLVLAYAGASLPLLLMFSHNPLPYSQVVNYEIIAEEIIRTLVGSIGLILTVPLTTYLAAVWYRK